VLMHFASTVENAAAWAAARGGTMQEGAEGVAHFAVGKPTDIGPLLDAAIRDGLEVIDVVLRRPNLESVFLHLTGRELRP
jgi:ABC-2 type transport system ATP-binding protein